MLTHSVLLRDEHLHLPANPVGFGCTQGSTDLSRSGGFKPCRKWYPIQQGWSNGLFSSAGKNGQNSWVTRVVSSLSEPSTNQNLLEIDRMVKIRQRKIDKMKIILLSPSNCFTQPLSACLTKVRKTFEPKQKDVLMFCSASVQNSALSLVNQNNDVLVIKVIIFWT